MKALILAGGEGTRLRPLTYDVPKSLLPICNRPFLEHQLRLLRDHGIHEAMLLTGYLAEEFAPFCDRMAGEGFNLAVRREERPLGTAGAVRNVLDILGESTLVFNGDVLTDLDLTALVASHRDRAAAVTITLTAVADASAYGLVPLAADGRVEAFLEKPPPEVARSGGLINAGTYVLEPEVLRNVPAGEMWSFERQVFPTLVERGAGVFGFPSDTYWLDIGTPQRYLKAHWDVLAGRSHAEPLGHRAGEILLDEGADAGDASGPAVLGVGARVAHGAELERAVLLREAAVERGSVVRDSVIGPGAVVGEGSVCEGKVIAVGDRFAG